jgi:hypothetical protein
MLTLLVIRKVFIMQESSYSYSSNTESLNHDIKVFKPALKDCLLSHPFFFVEYISI